MKQTYITKKKPHSSMYACEKDAETIIRRLFIESQPYSNELKRLLVINTKDCLDDSNLNYTKIVENIKVKDLMEGNYFTLTPKLKMKEHEEVKSYVVMSFDHFVPTATNPQYRDRTIVFDIICPTDYWDLGDYKLRPLKIAGIIDGILDDSKLSGIGTLHFLSMGELIVDENLAGYTLIFAAVNGNDDNLPPDGDVI